MSFEEYKEKIGSIEEKIASSGKERGAMFDNFKARLNELQDIITKNKAARHKSRLNASVKALKG